MGNGSVLEIDVKVTIEGRQFIRRRFSKFTWTKIIKDGQKLTSHGEGDEEPGLELGDIIIVFDWKGQIVKPGDIICVLNEGMLIYHRSYKKDCLVIKFKENFPENDFLSPDKLSLLEKLLPEREEVEESEEMDQIELVDFDRNQETWHHYNGEADEDDEHHPRGGVQCQTS
ncbi:DnaJ like protein subfamily A member 1 [Tupaia chinensis]|uniref:DnaJ like protein subfamily A member 1 n=1 Tax=Tupaia chinensis TaxID=246437 RepID=L9JB37_TUPCH|nr:DnaJ like protein subfamily A member 1 [Tupaia chinensis]